jgi:hypothetical protein
MAPDELWNWSSRTCRGSGPARRTAAPHRCRTARASSAGPAIADSVCVRAKKRGTMTGPGPVDRGKPGSKIHVLSGRAGLLLSVALSAANTNDAFALQSLVRAIPAIRSRRGPRRRKPARLHADKAYDQADLHAWVRGSGIAVRIARKGIEASGRLGRHRWAIERTMGLADRVPAADPAI